MCFLTCLIRGILIHCIVLQTQQYIARHDWYKVASLHLLCHIGLLLYCFYRALAYSTAMQSGGVAKGAGGPPRVALVEGRHFDDK